MFFLMYVDRYDFKKIKYDLYLDFKLNVNIVSYIIFC